MTVLTRDEIVKQRELQTELVPVPEWGGEVIVRALSGRERDAFEAAIVEQKGRKAIVNTQNIRARLVATAVVDEHGQPIFYPSDVDLLGEQSAAALDRVFSVARRLSGMSEDDVEELAKN